MEAVRVPGLRPVREVLGAGALTGAIAGLAAGAIDALWSWGPAGQFLPGFVGRLRYVGFAAVAHALAGLVIGLAITVGVLALSRLSRLGDLARFAWGVHEARR